jgi:molybdate-binding protein
LEAKLYDSFGTQKRVPLFSEWVCATDWLLIKSFSRRLGLFFTPANEKNRKKWEKFRPTIENCARR